MRWYVVIIFAYLLAVMQTALFTPQLLGLSAFGNAIRPDLLLLLALFVALRADAGAVFIAAWCLGLVEDLSPGHGPLGVTALLFALVASLVCLVRPMLMSTRILTQALMALAAVFVVRLPQQVLLSWLGGSPLAALAAVQRSVGDALYSAVLAPYVFWLLTKTVEKTEPLRR